MPVNQPTESGYPSGRGTRRSQAPTRREVRVDIDSRLHSTIGVGRPDRDRGWATLIKFVVVYPAIPDKPNEPTWFPTVHQFKYVFGNQRHATFHFYISSGSNDNKDNGMMSALDMSSKRRPEQLLNLEIVDDSKIR